MDQNQILLDTLIELTPQLYSENDGIPDGTLLLTHSTQVSNQNMVELGKRLLQAASENDIENVRLLMTGGAPFTGNWLGTTPLHAAAKAGHIDTVELLLKAGIFRDAKTKVDRTALQMAAEEGHTAIVQMLIDYYADVNLKDMLKMTALHWAVERGHKDTVMVLLHNGANVYTVNKFDKTPIDIANENGYHDLIPLLEAAASQSSTQEMNMESETATQKLVSELAADKSTSWRKTPEEEVLERLAATASESTCTETVQLLESHGITFLPLDNSNLVSSALESGQSVSLTEAGKMALNESKDLVVGPARPINTNLAKKLKLSKGATPRVVTITADQFLALAGKLKQSKGNKPMLITLPKGVTIPTTNNPSPKAVPSVANKAPLPTIKKPIPLANNQAEFVHSSNNKSNSINPAGAACRLSDVIPPIPDLISIAELSNAISKTTCPTNGINTVCNTRPTITESLSSPPTSIVASPKRVLPPKPVALTADNVVNDPIKPAGRALPRGSARTTPMALLCRHKKPAAQQLDYSGALTDPLALDNHSPTFGLLDENIFADVHDQETDSTSGNAVWLSIMEDENSQFITENDEDLLDPTRLAAQLASIRQAASQYSFGS